MAEAITGRFRLFLFPSRPSVRTVPPRFLTQIGVPKRELAEVIGSLSACGGWKFVRNAFFF
mgnify:CR=1 FL=1